MDKPLFSFVIPVYISVNEAKAYLVRCLDSVFAQRGDYEVVIVDDCSPIPVKEICERYQGKCRYVRHESNKGALQARLTGLRLAQGKYVVPVDYDDYVFLGLTDNLEKAVIDHDFPDVVSYWVEHQDPNGKLTMLSKPDTGEISCGDALCKVLRMEFLWNMWGKIFKTSTYRKAIDSFGISGIQANVGEDILQCLAILLQGSRFVSCRYVGYRYVHNEKSVTNDLQSRERFASHIADIGNAVFCCDRMLSGISEEYGNLFQGVRRRIVRWNIETFGKVDVQEWGSRINLMCGAFKDSEMVLQEFFEVHKTWGLGLSAAKEKDVVCAEKTAQTVSDTLQEKQKGCGDMNNPMFSFVVPVYGTEEYLPRCLDSLFAQTGDYEVIVVDDCSPGDIKGICEKYQGKCRYVRHDVNRGLLQARLTGLRLAWGKYIVPVDSDDYVLPELIDSLGKTVVKHDFPEVISYGMENEGPDGSLAPYSKPDTGKISCKDALGKMLRKEFLWNMCGKVFKTETYRQSIDGLDVSHLHLNTAEDLLQCIAIFLCGGSFVSCGYVGYRYVCNKKSITNNLQARDRFISHIEDVAKSLSYCDRMLSGCNSDFVQLYQNIKRQIIEWNLAPLKGLDSDEWNFRINYICKAFRNPRQVLSVCCENDVDFLSKYEPDQESFADCRGRTSVIGIVCCRGNGGGAERATLLWCREMVSKGYKIVWFCDSWFHKEMSALGAFSGVDVVPLEYECIANRVKVFGESIEKYKIDTVLLVDHWRDRVFYDLLVAKAMRCKTIVTEHNVFFFPFDDLNAQLFSLREKFYRIADVVTVLSPENVAWWRFAGFDNVVYMPNFLTFDVPEKLDVDYGEKLSRLEFVCVGRICRRKNAFAVLQAFRIFRDSYPELANRSHLSIIGRYEGARDREQIEAEIEKFNLAGCVTVTGEVIDIASYYKRATLHLMASRLEGAPMVIMEAKSYGVPTVMFELPYVDGAVEEDGVVPIRHGDVRAMAKAMHDCVMDRGRYERLSGSAVRSLERFDRKNITSRWDKVFQMLESGGDIDPMCEPVEPARMLPMTMGCISRLAPVLHGWWVDNVNKVWNSAQDADAARRLCADAVKDADVLKRLYADAIKEWNFWESEFIRIENCRSYKLGRMVTWPMRMARNSYLVLREDGFAEFCRRIPRKICNLKKRFIPVTK